MNTFDIKREYTALDALLNEIDENTGEFLNSADDISEYIHALEDTRDNKLDSIERLKRDNKSKEDAIVAEIKRLTAFKNQIVKTNARLTDLQFELTGGTKIDTAFYKFSSRKSTQVHVLDDRLLDSEYIVVKETTAPDKKAIKEALNNGVVVAGAELITNVSLSVK